MSHTKKAPAKSRFSDVALAKTSADWINRNFFSTPTFLSGFHSQPSSGVSTYFLKGARDSHPMMRPSVK